MFTHALRKSSLALSARVAVAAMVVTGLSMSLCPVHAQEAAAPSVPELMSIAIVSVKATKGLEAKITEPIKKRNFALVLDALDSQLVDRFHNTRKFKIVARADLDKVLTEQSLGASGNVDLNDPKVAQAFKLAGAEYALVFELNDFQDTLSFADVAGVRRITRSIRTAAIGKLWHTTTGVLKESMSFPALESQESYLVRTNVAGGGDGGDASDRLLLPMSRSIAEELANRAIDVMFPAKVLVRSGDQVTINRGDGGGVQVGQIWNAYAQGEVIKDPDTGEILGRDESPVGAVQIISVAPKFCKARVLDDKGLARGAVLRLASPPAGNPGNPGMPGDPNAPMAGQPQGQAPMQPAAPTQPPMR